MHYKELNDYELLDLIYENNEEARELLLNKYQPIIIDTAKKYYKTNKYHGIELEDLIQEGNYAIFKAIEKYKIDKDIKFYTYVTACIKKNIQTFCRKTNKRNYEVLNKAFSYEVCEPTTMQPYKNIITTETEKDPLNVVLFDDYYQKLNQLRLDLDKDTSAVFELRCNGFSYKEIAKLLDISYDKVGRYLKNIRIEMKKRSLDEICIN